MTTQKNPREWNYNYQKVIKMAVTYLIETDVCSSYIQSVCILEHIMEEEFSFKIALKRWVGEKFIRIYGLYKENFKMFLKDTNRLEKLKSNAILQEVIILLRCWFFHKFFISLEPNKVILKFIYIFNDLCIWNVE